MITARFRNLWFVAVCLALVACSATTSASAPTAENTVIADLPTATTAPTITHIVPTRLIYVATPTQTPSLTPSITFTPSATHTPTLPGTAIPTNTKRPSPTPRIIVTTISTSIPGIFGGDPATWTPPAPKPTPNPLDHYVFQRPIGEANTTYWARNYSYGSTDGGTRPVHHGVDLPNETGVPVLAAGDGVIFYAGPDTTILFGPQPDFYGNVIVISHDIKDSDGQPIYTLYGHLSLVEVSKGQHVKTGFEIGQVGSAGVAIGSHLHFEVRAGNPFDYNATLNPELWVIPYQNAGVIAGRVADLNDTIMPGLEVEVQSLTEYRFAYTYGDGTVNGDPLRQENFVIPDLPEGYYNIFIKVQDTLRYKSLVYVYPARTTMLDIHLTP